jgi:hypothetical protein
MRDEPHLRLEGTGSAEDYVYAGGGGGGTFDRPERNQPAAHAKKVGAELKGVGEAVKSQRAKEVATHPELVDYEADGVVLTFRSDPNFELSVDRLERDQAKSELIGVKFENGVQIARVFVPHDKVNVFLKLIDGYSESVILTYLCDPESEQKIVGMAEPDNGIKFRGPVRDAKPDDLTSAGLDDSPRKKIRFVVEEAAVSGFKEQLEEEAVLLSEDRPNQDFVESIASVRLAIVEDFWQDTLDFPKPDEEIWWEVWLRGNRGNAAAYHERFTNLASIVGIDKVSELYVAFPERVVVHARATSKQFSSSVDLLAMIGELRKGKELAGYYVDMGGADQAAFVADVAGRLILPGADAPCVCVLDAGVNRPHPLLSPALAEADQHTVVAEWGVADHDEKYQHGTGMAGISLYGCLTEVMRETGKIRLRHKLESVKILPLPPDKTEPPDYGRRMQNGVTLAHVNAPDRNRAICMAVTTPDHRDGGVPSLWSAAADDLCSGGYDGTRRLMFISAGNMRDEIGVKEFVYHEWNRTRGGVEDPGQSWNALTIGAFTEKIEIRHKNLKDWAPMAQSGDICPTSRTSLAWPLDRQSGWPIKPDLVMEGGNRAFKEGQPPLECDDLSLLTTYLKPGVLLTGTCDTSPATALAARMAAIIWSHYPSFWPETVRALMVHSASWTPAMLERFPGDQKTTILQRLRCYGYGVPSLSHSLRSAKNDVTMIHQGELQPFKLDGSEVKTNHMDVHDLPWPVEVLQELGEEPIMMRVTLSYFIEPSPGNVGWGTNHRYASHGLRFDVIRPTESPDGFMKRISRAFWESPNKRPTNVKETRNWVVGEDNRSLGSLHSDWWVGTAAALANAGKIVVYPVSGWWRERKHLNRYNQPAKYCLIVSIHSKKENLDLYTPICNVGAIPTEIVE